MTTPGGVSNLPKAALTLDSLASKLQDMTPAAMRNRAGERMPGIFNSSNGGNPLNDLTPFGILTRIWAEVNSLVANADPADIQGPEDLPPLLLEFISGLPVIGELIGLLEAILGEYEGDDDVLLAIQEIFRPIRVLMQLVSGQDVTFPTPEEIVAGWENLGDAALRAVRDALTGIVDATPTDLDNWLLDLLTQNSPLNATNIFGQLSLPQFGGGVSITDLTTATANLLEPFTEVSVPTADGWSYDAVEDAARVIADGTTKTLYLRSGVIKVEEGQPLNTTISVKYSGVTSGAGQTIRYVLETFTSADGSGTPTPVTVAAITNPTGSGGPTALGDSSWDIPAGVQSVRPVLLVDELVTAGTVWWLNTPHLHKILLGVLADGIAAAIEARIAEFTTLINNLWTNPGAVIASIPQALVSGLTGLAAEANQIRDILAGLAVTPINSAVQDIKDWWTGLGAKTQNLTSGGELAIGKVTGLPAALSDLGNDITTGVGGLASAIFDGWFGSGGTGAVNEAQYTIEAIKDAVLNGYTVETKTSSGSWTKPGSITELIVICVGGGQNGSAGNGGTAGATGGPGGLGGGYIAQVLDPGAVSGTVSCTVGGPGQVSTFGGYVSSTPGAGGIATAFGYSPTASMPGAGGAGGKSHTANGSNDGTNGDTGESSALGSGGAGGAHAAAGNGGSGTSGGAVSVATVTKCGGGGGGGGGGSGWSTVPARTGGPGGPGGYPGGGGGGGGGGRSTGGSAGGGAGGVIWIFYR